MFMSMFFQHLVWILGLKPASGHGGQLRPGRNSGETSAVLTTAVMSGNTRL